MNNSALKGSEELAGNPSRNANLYAGRRIILAPMAGVSDEAFREICLGFGAQLTYTEMVSAKALSYGNAKTRDLLALAPSEEKVAVQIFGHEPETMANEAFELEQAMGNALFSIDINMGCPARKIAGKGDGAALMRDPSLAFSIVKAIVGKVSCPVTVKMRRGFENGVETAPELAYLVQEAGASAVAVHGRFAQQFYQGQACWDTVARVKERLCIPVVGNGDITSGNTAKAMLEQTGCDAIMIGRAAEGNPWIFSEVSAYLERGEVITPPTAEERVRVALSHARMLADSQADKFDTGAEFAGESSAWYLAGSGSSSAENRTNNLVKFRKHAAWYTKGLKGASFARQKFNTAVTYEDFEHILCEVLAIQEAQSLAQEPHAASASFVNSSFNLASC